MLPHTDSQSNGYPARLCRGNGRWCSGPQGPAPLELKEHSTHTASIGINTEANATSPASDAAQADDKPMIVLTDTKQAVDRIVYLAHQHKFKVKHLARIRSEVILDDEDASVSQFWTGDPLVVSMIVPQWTDERIKAKRKELQRLIYEDEEAAGAALATLPFHDADKAEVLSHPYTMGG